MSKLKALCTATITEKYMLELQKLLDVEVDGWAVTGDFMPEARLIERLRGAEILIAEYEEVTRRVIDQCPALKLIVCPRGTPVNVDCEAAAERGIPVVHTPGRNANSVAEMIVASMINASRHICLANHEIKNGRYLGGEVSDVYAPSDQDDVVWMLEAEDSPFKAYRGCEISGRTLGFIGFGAIGARTTELLKGFEMEFLAYDPYCASEVAAKYGVRLAPLNEVLAGSAYVSVNCKVTRETVGMIGKAQFETMKRTAYFINTARGSIVRQKDLVEALQQSQIAGAALDVFWREPLPKNHPLLALRNVQITPHIAGASSDVANCHSRMVLQEITRFVCGEPLERVYNRKQLSLRAS